MRWGEDRPWPGKPLTCWVSSQSTVAGPPSTSPFVTLCWSVTRDLVMHVTEVTTRLELSGFASSRGFYQVCTHVRKMVRFLLPARWSKKSSTEYVETCESPRLRLKFYRAAAKPRTGEPSFFCFFFLHTHLRQMIRYQSCQHVRNFR